MVKAIALFVTALVLVGCNYNEENEESAAARRGALVITCPPNIPIYEWKNKLYYKEPRGYSFRRVVATLDDVCTKFIALSVPPNKAEASVAAK
ncbi:MAG: hypothetical protein WBA62_17590 [Xanthobacteraceae bacterium]